MKKIKNNRKIIMLLVFVFVLVVITVFGIVLRLYINSKIELGEEKYNLIHEFYNNGSGIEYVYNDKDEIVFIEDSSTGYKYYKVNSNSPILDIIHDNLMNDIETLFDLKKVDGDNYIRIVGKGISGYYGTKLEIKKISKNKIEYKAISTLCYINSRTSYGEGCTSDGYYKVEKPFILIKEDGLWKVSEYTSIFQFSYREIK